MFAGGKRLRPVLCLAACEACGGIAEEALRPAAAIEMMHTYSLVHDDLPAMDDDDLRRGKPTCHVVYGEAIAILAGDALLTHAFTVMAGAPGSIGHPPLELVKELALAGDSIRLIGGQVLDLEGEGKSLSLDELRTIHENKTGALLTAAIRCGAMSGNASPEQLEALTRFGKSLGLAFQVIDDILDITQDSTQLGKTAGKDLESEKSTYPALMGLDGAKAEAKRLTNEALAALEVIGKPAARLEEIARYMLERPF